MVVTHSRCRKKAGHRSWAAAGQPVAGIHNGDTMSATTRSRVMASIKGQDTTPEKIFAELIREHGVPFKRHAGELPGRPDFVFWKERLIVFVDGDFWHGWRFPLWRHKLSEAWAAKISSNRERDLRNFRRLRASGWTVMRFWEHQLEHSPARCNQRFIEALEKARQVRTPTRIVATV